MLFNLRDDLGGFISAYVVPDTGGTIPSVRIRSNGTDLLVLKANETIVEFVTYGRHATGTCGFLIDETLVPGLASYSDLEIIEADTNVLIYRRPIPNALPNTTVFRLETHLLPLWRIDEALRSRFQYWYQNIDRFGRETSSQVLNRKNVTSCYASGRLQYKNYEMFLSKGFKTIAMFRDPFDEMAERLILLKNIGTRAVEVLGERDAIVFEAVIEALGEYEHLDEAFCKRFFKRAPDTALAALANPMVRQLTTGTPDEMPSGSSVASALDVLSTFEVVGIRSDGVGFRDAIQDLLGLEDADLPIPAEYARVTELGQRLRQNPTSEMLLEKDVELFDLLVKAFQVAAV